MGTSTQHAAMGFNWDRLSSPKCELRCREAPDPERVKWVEGAVAALAKSQIRFERFLGAANRLEALRNVPIEEKARELKRTTGDSGDGVARERRLLAQVKLLEKLLILGEVVTLDIVEQFTTAGSHLQQAAATMEVLAVGAKMLGQVIDSSGKDRDLDFGRSGILIVGFEFCDDFGFSDCRHMVLFRCSRL
jgi:hypothetical protein